MEATSFGGCIMITQSSLDKVSRKAQRRISRKSAGRTNRLPDLQYLESRQLLTADLTGTFTSVPTTAVNGSSQLISLQVSNNGDTRTRGPIAVDLFVQPVGSAAVGTRVRRLIVGALRPGQ